MTHDGRNPEDCDYPGLRDVPWIEWGTPTNRQITFRPTRDWMTVALGAMAVLNATFATINLLFDNYGTAMFNTVILMFLLAALRTRLTG